MRECVAAGDEAVLHGLLHAGADGRDGAEFRARTGPREAARRISAGLADLRVHGVHTGGFIAPAYRHPARLDVALRACGLAWWATRGRLVTPRGAVSLPSIGLGASTPVRRTLSPHAARLARRALAPAAALRVDLHPADVHHRRLADGAEALLEAVAREGRRPVRHADLVLRVAG